jgi:hypothetical protein
MRHLRLRSVLPIASFLLLAIAAPAFALDLDGDLVDDSIDNCLLVSNPDQLNTDGDLLGDACDLDDDDDGVLDLLDNCPLAQNNSQANADLDDDGGNACDLDDDNDLIPDVSDNCVVVGNFLQSNNDGDLLGDVCDPDDDNDGVLDIIDNCVFAANLDQLNSDGLLDGGDACDADDDNDGVIDLNDECPGGDDTIDFDGDTVVDGCDRCITAGSGDFAAGSRLLLKKIGTDAESGNDALSLQGSFVAGTEFLALRPDLLGATLTLLADDGSVVADIVLPSGDAWKMGSKSFGFGPNDTNNGILKIKAKDASGVATNLVKVTVKAKGGDYDGAGTPVQAVLVVGDPADGQCGETTFAGADCALNGIGNVLSCVQP